MVRCHGRNACGVTMWTERAKAADVRDSIHPFEHSVRIRGQDGGSPKHETRAISAHLSCELLSSRLGLRLEHVPVCRLPWTACARRLFSGMSAAIHVRDTAQERAEGRKDGQIGSETAWERSIPSLAGPSPWCASILPTSDLCQTHWQRRRARLRAHHNAG
jgi:hypothetical protein